MANPRPGPFTLLRAGIPTRPDPEADRPVDRVLASRYAAVVATGGRDVPEQHDDVLARPALLRGLLDVEGGAAA